ncbi:Glucose 1-dehydrogenase [Thalassocella blandensis]|nr:Glucose 1-dehydrogenase [Thalassocella blandensis]
MNKRFEGYVSVITGGNSGIGSATAHLFRNEGAKVALFGRNHTKMASVLNELGSDSLGFIGDVTSTTDLQCFFNEVKQKYGKIDSLFVNAGISKSASIEQMSEEFFDELFNVNVKGSMFTIKLALPLMKENSSIVVTTSNTLHNGYDQLSAYSATKGALRSMVRSLSAELLSRKIRINSICPGPIATRLLTKDFDQSTHDSIMSNIAENIPVKRMGEANEIAKAVLFLSSTDSSFMTGEEIIVDGGMTAIG